MVDEKDFIFKKYKGKDKVRVQKWFMHYCDLCSKQRSYAPRNKSALCISCSCKGRTISQVQKESISNKLIGNKNASNITKEQIVARTAKRMNISVEKYIAEKSVRLVQRKVRKNMLDRLNRFLRGQRKSVKYFPFSRKELMKHLESKFESGMSWNNYGRLYGRKSWELDHIIPLRYKEDSEFYWNQQELADSSSETFKKAWSLDNLQPKWDEENWSKGARSKG